MQRSAPIKRCFWSDRGFGIDREPNCEAQVCDVGGPEQGGEAGIDWVREERIKRGQLFAGASGIATGIVEPHSKAGREP